MCILEDRRGCRTEVLPTSIFWVFAISVMNKALLEVSKNNPLALRPYLLPHPSMEEAVHEAGSASSDKATPAAVLITLLASVQGTQVILTRRTDHLRDHPGQISFPGGRCEAADSDPAETALRETQEEIGLAAEHLEILGYLPDYCTGTGYRVTPVVATTKSPVTLSSLQADVLEVAEIFTVPLDFLLNPANHTRHALLVRGNMREYHAMSYGPYFIWGATAGMIVSLVQRCGIVHRPD